MILVAFYQGPREIDLTARELLGRAGNLGLLLVTAIIVEFPKFEIGSLDIALIETPHIGGILKIFRYTDSGLQLFSEYAGVSNHRIGSTELGLGRVVSSSPRDLLLVPNQAHRALVLLEWSEDGVNELARIELPGRLESSLMQSGENRWRFRLVSGEFYKVSVQQ